MIAAYKGDGFRFRELVAYLAKLLKRPGRQHSPKIETPTPPSYGGATWRTNSPVVTFVPLVKREQRPPAAPFTAKPPPKPGQPGSPGSAKRVGDLLAKAIVANLNEHVAERYCGVHEKDLPGFPRDGYSDAQIAASKRAAAGALALAALPDFGPTAVFFDVEGDPVSFDGKALRWVGGKPTPISWRSAARGIHITKDRFRAIVSAASTQR